jgi:hypothetical protein
MYITPCWVNQFLNGFSLSGTLLCSTPSIYVAGLLGQTLYYNGTEWAATSNIWNDNTNVGIWTATPGARLEVNGDAIINSLTIGRWSGSIASNTALGYQGLFSNQTGINNVGIGYQSLYDNVSGYWNSALGYHSLHNTLGDNNTAFGFESLFENITGSNNTAFWVNSLYQNSIGSNNTALGYQSLSSLISGDYNIAIGSDAQVPSSSGSGQLSIWNWIYGSGWTIGIWTGSLDTLAKLKIAWQIQITGGSPGVGKVLTTDATGLASWTGTVTATSLNLSGSQVGSTIYFDGFNWIPDVNIYNLWWNVGIWGTITPGEKLHVVGNIAATWQFKSPTTASYFDPTSNVIRVTNGYIDNLYGSDSVLRLVAWAWVTYFPNWAWNVGIWTATPWAKLEVNWQVKITGWNVASGRILTSDATWLAFWQDPGVASSVSASWITGWASGYLSVFGSGWNGLYSSIVYQSGWRMGIWTTTPDALLDVAGQVKITGWTPWVGKVLTSDATGLAVWWDPAIANSVYATGVLAAYGSGGYITEFMPYWTGITSSTIFRSGSNIGIWNTNPWYTLDVTGTSRVTGNAVIGGTIQIVGWTPAAGRVLTSDASGNATWINPSVATSVYATWVLAAYGSGGYITKFIANGSGITSSRLYESGSNIGIWNTNPWYNLDVTGTIRTTGTATFGSNIAVTWNTTIAWTLSVTGNTFLGWTIQIQWGSPWLGKILVSDANGLASWATYASGATATGITGGASGYLSVFWAGWNGLYSSQLFQTGTRIWIWTATPGYTLDVNGTGNLVGLRLPTWANNNYILTSDASGNARWLANNYVESDPQVWANTTNYLSKWNGTSLVTSQVFDNGTNVGIWTWVPWTYKLNVAWNTYISGNVTVSWSVITDKIVNRTVANVSISGSLLPDAAAPLVYRDIGANGTRWNNLYLSWQVKIWGWSPWLGKILVSDANGLASWATYASGATATGITGWASGYLSVFWAGWNGLYSSQLFQTGTRIWIWTATPGYTLDVNGTGNLVGLRLPTWAAAGRMLTTDASWNVSWTWLVTATSLNITWSVLGSTLYFNGTAWTAGTGIYNTGWNIGIWTSTPTAKLTIDSGVANTSGLRLIRTTALSANYTWSALGLGIDNSGNVVPIPKWNIAVYTSRIAQTTQDTVNFLLPLSYNQYFIPGQQQTFTTTDVSWLPAYAPNLALWTDNNSVCNGTGTGVSAWCVATPWANFASSAYNINPSWTSYAYQLVMSDRVDSPLFFRWGRLKSSTWAMLCGSTNSCNLTWGIFNSDGSRVANWFSVLTVPANHGEFLYINPWVDVNNNPIAGWWNIGLGTATPWSKFEIWSWSTAYMHFRWIDNIGIGMNGTDIATTGRRNIWIGSLALDLVTSGWWNVALWYRAGNNITTGSNNITIGSGTNVVSATASNQLNIGNWIYGSGGKIGIGTSSLATNAILKVGWQIEITWGTPWLGKILVSDANGLASWATYASGATATGITGGASGYLSVFWAGWNGLYSSQLFQTGTRIWIWTATPGYTLDVNGTGNLVGLRLPTWANNNYILTSDASGNARWLANNYVESDPQVWANTTNYLSKWNGTSLVTSQVFDNGSNVGIWTGVPGSYRLNVNWNTYISGNITVSGSVITDKLVNRTVNNVSISGSLLPDTAAPLVYRDIWSNGTRWNNLYLSWQVKIWGGSPWLGKILVSDANGLATWATYASGATATGITGWASGYLSVFWAGWNGLYSSQLFQTGTRIWIWTTTPGYTLDVNGTGNLVGLRLPTWANNNYILTSDASGNARWSSNAPTATSVYATWVIAMSSSGWYLTKFITNGSGITSARFYESGAYIGLGTTNPSAWLDIVSSLMIRGGTPYSGWLLTSDGNWLVRWTTPYKICTPGGTGVDNICYGDNALQQNTTGDNNVALGDDALYANTIWWHNIALGRQTLYSNTSGSVNVAIGLSSLYSNSTWSFNVAIGRTALYTNTIWQNNIAIWSDSLYSNTGWVNNIAIGSNTLRSSRWSNNTAIGTDSLYSNTTWYGNQWIGYRSLYQNTIGYYNTAFGYQALTSNIDWIENTAIWYQALAANTGWISNVAIGQSALTANKIWNYNTAVGNNTLVNNQADGNVALGDAALNANVDWVQNTALGTNALWSNISGTANVAIWTAALEWNESEWNVAVWWKAGWRIVQDSFEPNIAIGTEALVGGHEVTPANNTAWQSIAIGYHALRGTIGFASTGDENIAIGNYSMETNRTGQFNTAIGVSSLNNITSGSNNTILWRESWQGITTGSGNTIIGANVTGLTSSLTNNIIIADGLGNRRINVSSTGAVGIWKNNPWYLLDVAWTGAFTGVRITLGASNGYVLTSDSSWNARWTNSVSGATATWITGWTQNYVPKFGTGGTWLYLSQIIDTWTWIGVGATWWKITTKFVVDSWIDDDSGFRLSRLDINTPLTSNGVLALWINGSGKVLPISPISNIAVYTWVLRTTPLSPNPDLNTFDVTYNFNQYFAIPGKQSFVVSKWDGPSNNGPYFKENGTSPLCSITGTYGTSPYDCANPDPATGISASPYNSFTMTAKGDTFGYQLAVWARWDAPLFARSGRFNGSQTGWLYTNDSPYQTPAPWQRVLSLPANHPEYLFINTWLNSQLQAISWGGNVAIGTTTPNSRFEVWTGATTTSLLHFRGIENVWLGLNSLNTAVTWRRNIALWVNGLDVVTSGWYNIAIGSNAGNTLTTGSNNIMIGSGVNVVNTASNQLNIWNWIYGTGGYIAVGNSNPASNFEVWSWASTIIHFRWADNNVGFGLNASRYQASGTANSAFGDDALRTATTWYSNTAMGYSALFSNSTWFFNTAGGTQSLSTNSDGTWNVWLGSQSLFTNLSWDNNVALGWQAIYLNSTGDNNVAVGYQALRATTVGPNIGIGTMAWSGITTGTNNIMIGHNVQATSNTQSNQLNVGNWIYGSGGKIGIGTNWLATSAILKVAGQIEITGGVPWVGKVLTSNAAWLATWETPSGGGGGWWTTGNGGTTAGTNYVGTSDAVDFVIWTNGTEKVRVESAGDVGIGKTNPAYKLDVAGTGAFYGLRISSGANNWYVLTSDASGNAYWASGGGGGGWTTILQATQTLNLPSINNNNCSVQSFTVTGATTGKAAWVSPQNDIATSVNNTIFIAYARVSAADTVQAKFCNEAGVAVDVASMNYYISVIQ